MIDPSSAGRARDREILRLAVPALGALVAEPLFLLADAAIVGNLGTAPLAGLGVAGAVLSTLVYLCVFLAYATTAAVGRSVGAGDLRAAAQQGIDGLWLAAGLGVVLALAGAAAAPVLVDALGATPAARPFALVYLRVSAVGLPAMLVVLAATGALRGALDVRTPLVVAATGAAANVGLNYVLVYPAGWGIAGSALGTVIAQVGMAAALTAVVVRRARRHGASLRPDSAGIRTSASASGALFLRTLTLRIYLLAAVAWAGAAGTVALAAHTVAVAVWGFLALALDAVAIAAQALVARGLGAGDVGDVRAVTRRLAWWGLWSGAGTGVLVLACLPWAPGLFSPDPAVRHLLGDVLVLVALLQVVAGVTFALDGVLIGAGDHAYLAVTGVATLAVFLVAAWAATAAGGGLVGLWWAVGAHTAARLAVLVARTRGSAWLRTGAAPPGGRGGRPA
ncbi:MAG: MATE family efflux transporter [Kineosporiaceae bacterium]